MPSSLFREEISIFAICKFFESLGNSLFFKEISLGSDKLIHCGDCEIRDDVQESENRRSNHQRISGT